MSNIRINALYKWLRQVTPEDGPMVLDIMKGVMDSISGMEKDYLDIPRFDNLLRILETLSEGKYEILPIREEK